MAVQWVLVCHGLITLLVLVSFLCGQWPIFQGTFIERIHVFLTFGAYDYFLYSLSLSQSILFHSYSSLIHLFDCFGFYRRFVGAVFGSKGTNAILSVEYFCCDRPNPILQVCHTKFMLFLYPIGLFWNEYFFFLIKKFNQGMRKNWVCIELNCGFGKWDCFLLFPNKLSFWKKWSLTEG